MKRQVRLHIYETASSSIHSLAISSKHIYKSKLKIADDGYVHVSLTEYYGKDKKDYKGQREKLTYIVTWMYIYYGCSLEGYYGCDPYGLLKGSLWRDFNKTFADYVGNGCKGIWIDKTMFDGDEMASDYLDHQSVPWGAYDDDKCVVNLYDTEQLINFIFNPYLWLHTDCD